MSDHLIAEANRHAMALPTTHPTHADIAWYVREVSELRAEVKESKGRERVAIASWDEERQRALREGGRVVELRAEVERLTARESNQSERIRYLEGATNHATGTPLSQAIARAERAEAELTTERARLDSGQILLTVSGERVWHCGLDLRAAIDAAMKEETK